MKKFAAVLLILITVSCAENQAGIHNGPERNYEYIGGIWSHIEYKIEEKEIDKCEYIIILGMESRNIIHKANCRNSFHTSNLNSNY